MKTILHLTFEDGLKVVDALKNVALENGWEEDEIAECCVVEEYSRVVDAALTAMGFGLEIENASADEEDFPEEEEEEEEEEKEEDDGYLCSLTLKNNFVIQFMETGYSLEEALKVANILFGDGE